MVAIVYNSNQMLANGGTNARNFGIGHGLGGDIKGLYFEGVFTAAPLITDYIRCLIIPKGFRYLGVAISATDMDTSTGMLLDLGDSGDTDRLLASAAVGQANTMVVTPRASGTNLGFGYKYTADTELWCTVQVAPSGTGSAGTVFGAIFGTIEGVAS